jgi:predicted RND superfamily exporter protein
MLITATILMSLTAVIGLSVLADVSLTGFSIMSFVLSVGFAVEYSVHIVARWLRADNSMTTSLERVKHTMSFLMLPTFMSWVSSTIGVVCLAFTEFEFNKVFFFRPLMIVMMVTYFLGCYALPAFLTYLNFDVCRLGKTSPEPSMYFTKSLALHAFEANETITPVDVLDESLELPVSGANETITPDDVLDDGNVKSTNNSSQAPGSSDKGAPESLEEIEF